MSIFIKGLNVPSTYPVTVIINPTGAVFVDYGGARFETLEAVDVPAPHGRLIDADALKEWIEAWFTMHRGYHPYSKSNLIPSTEIVDILDRLPTIIEAEEDSHE